MTLGSKASDTFAQDLHRRVTELIRSAEPTVEEINRLFFLMRFFEDQARDLRKAAERRARKYQEAHREQHPA